MAFKPDYGMLRMREGFSPDADLFFYDLRMFSLTVLGRGEYSTTVDMEFGGQTYCLSLDFSHAQLKQILAKTPGVAPLVNAELLRDPISVRSIEFNGSVRFGVRARLGPVQTTAKEQFVPLIAQEIW
jgi:hypothetical protein